MLNAYTPFNTLGELAAHGWAHLVLASSAAGFLMAVSTRIASGLRGGFQISASLLILAATTYFSLSILQYNLRSSARLVWYVFLGVTMLWFAALTMTRRSAESVAVRNEVGAKGSRVNRSGQLVVPGDGMPQSEPRCRSCSYMVCRGQPRKWHLLSSDRVAFRSCQFAGDLLAMCCWIFSPQVLP